MLSCFKELSLIKPEQTQRVFSSILSLSSIRQDAGPQLGLIPSPKLWCWRLWSRVSGIKETGTSLDLRPSVLGEEGGQRVEVQGLAICSSRGLQVLQSFKRQIQEQKAKQDLRPLGWWLTFRLPPHHPALGPRHRIAGWHTCTHTTLQSKVMQCWKPS